MTRIWWLTTFLYIFNYWLRTKSLNAQFFSVPKLSTEFSKNILQFIVENRVEILIPFVLRTRVWSYMYMSMWQHKSYYEKRQLNLLHCCTCWQLQQKIIKSKKSGILSIYLKVTLIVIKHYLLSGYKLQSKSLKISWKFLQMRKMPNIDNNSSTNKCQFAGEVLL